MKDIIKLYIEYMIGKHNISAAMVSGSCVTEQSNEYCLFLQKPLVKQDCEVKNWKLNSMIERKKYT